MDNSDRSTITHRSQHGWRLRFGVVSKHMSRSGMSVVLETTLARKCMKYLPRTAVESTVASRYASSCVQVEMWEVIAFEYIGLSRRAFYIPHSRASEPTTHSTCQSGALLRDTIAASISLTLARTSRAAYRKSFSLEYTSLSGSSSTSFTSNILRAVFINVRSARLLLLKQK